MLFNDMPIDKQVRISRRRALDSLRESRYMAFGYWATMLAYLNETHELGLEDPFANLAHYTPPGDER